jgi:hypothetical protein
MNPSITPAHFNLTTVSNPVIGSRVTATLLIVRVFVFAATGEQAGAFLACALLSIAWPLFLHAWFGAPEKEENAALTRPAVKDTYLSASPVLGTVYFPVFAEAR